MNLRHWNPFTWETGLDKLEPAYLKYYLKTDTAQIQFASLLSIVLSLYFIRADFLFFGFTRVFYAILCFRGAYLVTGMLILFRLSRPLDPEQLRRIMSVQLWTAVVFMSIVNSTRPRDYMDYSTVNMIFLFTAYLFNSLPVMLRFYGAFSFTMLEFINLHTKMISPESWLALASSYALVNILGFIIAIWFANSRRQQFLLWFTERKHRQKMEKLSNHDALTGIKNRRFFMARGAAEVERAARYARPLSLVVIDIDDLKGLNDRYGHPFGDKALCALVDVFRDAIRKQDVFARLGGDEFGLLMPETNLPEALLLINRIKFDLSKKPLDMNDGFVHLSFSAGVVEANQESSLTVLVHQADQKLYQAKNNGRNQVVE